MKEDLQLTIKRVVFFNVIVGFILTMVVYVLSKRYIPILLLGLAVATFNFVINGLVTSCVVSKQGGKIYSFLSSIVRVVLVAVIGYVLYTYNTLNVIFYILGYSAQFISLVLYGLTVKS